MRRVANLTLLLLAAACWVAAGPGGLTVRALLACDHHHATAGHARHIPEPGEGPCFCGEMTGASDLAAVSPAVPAPEPPAVLGALVLAFPDLAPVPLPPSPSFAPASPPPDGLV